MPLINSNCEWFTIC